MIYTYPTGVGGGEEMNQEKILAHASGGVSENETGN